MIVTLAQAKAHLQIQHTAADDSITLQIEAAENFVAEYLNVLLRDDDGTVVELLPGGERALIPNQRPVLSVSLVEDTEDEDTEVTDFDLVDRRYLIKDGLFWWAFGVNRWRVTYVAGYDADSAPAAIKLGILDLVWRSYNARGGTTGRTSAGTSYTYDPLMESDILARLKPFRMRVNIS